MASTHFTTGTTITSEWLNDVNDAVYNSTITAEGVQYTPPFTGAVITNVENKLAQTISVKDFGAVGDGVTDDTAAIQAALNACAINNFGALLFPDRGPYLISDTLLIRNGQQTTSDATGSNIHFMPDQNKLVIQADAHTVIKATASIGAMFELSPTTVNGAGTYANFYTEIKGLLLDGNNLADIGIYVNEAMHVKIENNAICNVNVGIYNTGYGVHDVLRNVIRANNVGIHYVGGGDSHFEHNDIYIPTDKTGILLVPFAGSSLLLRNTFTPNDTTVADSNTKAIELRADNPGDNVKELGAIRIIANAFDGVRYGVYGRGYSNSIINLKGIEICSNYIGAAGSCIECELANFAFANTLNIHDNDITPSYESTRVKSLGTFYGVSYSRIHNNAINGCNDDGIIFDGGCVNNYVESNRFFDVGAGDNTNAYVRVKGTSTYTYVQYNTFVQNDGTGAVNGVVEEGSANGTYCDYNKMYSTGVANIITVEYVKTGIDSIMTSRLKQSSTPVSGTWLAGARLEIPFPASGAPTDYVCTTGGTPGTWKVYSQAS